VVHSVPRSLEAIRRGDSVSGEFFPEVSSLVAFSFVVGGNSLFSLRVNASVFSNDILGVLLVELAERGAIRKNSNISPGRRMPVRIVVSFLRAFKSVSVSIVVLSSKSGRGSSFVESSFIFSVSNEESQVSVSSGAVLVVLEVFVHTIEQVSIGVSSNRAVGVVGDGIGGGTISN
jgi:hypothetical protein